MSKHIARLAEAELHPGVAVLRDIADGRTFYQFPMSEARNLLGHRKEAFYHVTVTPSGVSLGEEVPVESLPQCKS